MPIELIIFDCDGVLVDTEAISTRVIAEEARKIGSQLTDQQALKTFAGTSLQFCKNYIEKETGRSLPNDFEPIYRKRTFELFEQELQPIEGIHELIGKLRIPFCVASNAPRNKVEFNLKLTNLYPFFKGNIFSAYEVNTWKPDPTLFLTAAKTMGFSPEKCLVVEDSHAGVKAGIAGGMRVLGYTKGEKTTDFQALGAKTITHLNQVLDFIK